MAAKKPKLSRKFFEEKGREGGSARAKKLTAEERSAIARKAAKVRWKKVK